MAKEKLGDRGDVSDPAAVRELVDAALRGAKDALGELRSLARGIHPPVLDTGLADALATLAADSAIPAELSVSILVRPTPRGRHVWQEQPGRHPCRNRDRRAGVRDQASPRSHHHADRN